jgi:hypothetical protein
MSKELSASKSSDIRDLIQEANDHHNLAITAAKNTLVHARDSGIVLLELKERCQHGSLTKMIEDNDGGLNMSMRTAQRYMQIAREYDSIVEEMGASRAAVVSLSEGLRAIKAKEKNYYPDDAPNASRVSFLDGDPLSTVCPHGGPHIYDEEACINCHDPKPTDVEAEAALAARLRKMDQEQELKTLFASTESLYCQLTQQLDKLHKLSPYAEKEGIQTALAMSYDNFRKWRLAAQRQ